VSADLQNSGKAFLDTWFLPLRIDPENLEAFGDIDPGLVLDVDPGVVLVSAL
jgi:hypothetical protein